MVDTMTIWHYPRCSKSRRTLEILEEAGVDVEIRRYRENPPDVETLTEVVDRLGIAPRQLVRTKEDLYGELDVDEEAFEDDDWIELLAEHPQLLQRPIVLMGDEAVLGRPPENVRRLVEG